MMKHVNFDKIFLTLMLLTLFLVCGQHNKVFAEDCYAGTYPSGLHAYVMTETVVMGTPGFRRFDVTVKAVDDRGRLVSYLDYHFWNDPAKPIMFSNSEGYRGEVNSSTPVEQNIWNIAQPISSQMWEDK